MYVDKGRRSDRWREIFEGIENQKIYYRVLWVEVDVRFMKQGSHTSMCAHIYGRPKE